MRYYFQNSTPFSSDRRELARFELKLPAKVEMLERGKRQVFQLVTSNISAKAAYFQMLHPISEGVRVRLTINIGSEIVRKITGFQMRLMTEGRVLRSEPKGMAIQFDGNQKTERLIAEQDPNM